MSQSIQHQIKKIIATHTDLYLCVYLYVIVAVENFNLHFILNQTNDLRMNEKEKHMRNNKQAYKDINKMKCKKCKKNKNEFEKNNIFFY